MPTGTGAVRPLAGAPDAGLPGHRLLGRRRSRSCRPPSATPARHGCRPRGPRRPPGDHGRRRQRRPRRPPRLFRTRSTPTTAVLRRVGRLPPGRPASPATSPGPGPTSSPPSRLRRVPAPGCAATPSTPRRSTSWPPTSARPDPSAGLHAVERDLWASGPLDADVRLGTGCGPGPRGPVPAVTRARSAPRPSGPWPSTSSAGSSTWPSRGARSCTPTSAVDIAATRGRRPGAFADHPAAGPLVAPVADRHRAGSVRHARRPGGGPRAPRPRPGRHRSRRPTRLALSQQLDATASPSPSWSARSPPTALRGAPS